MARQRASQARDAFARVGTAPVSGISEDDEAAGDASITASGNAGIAADPLASGAAGQKASAAAGPHAGKPRRRAGRPRGPERVALTIRILAATDRRLTAAVEQTGQSPQYIVDAALAAYFDGLDIPVSLFSRSAIVPLHSAAIPLNLRLRL
jgi:hypothetical protein